MVTVISDLPSAFGLTVSNPTPDTVVINGMTFAYSGVCESGGSFTCFFGTGADSDGDRLADEVEAFLGSDPNDTDSDNDGLDDIGEVVFPQSDPTNPDTDGDGLTDGEEWFTYGTNLKLADTDGDGVPDGRDPDPLDMFVVPESPIGSIGVVVSSLAALLGFIGIQAYRKRHQTTLF
jgi:hypothetical protein